MKTGTYKHTPAAIVKISKASKAYWTLERRNEWGKRASRKNWKKRGLKSIIPKPSELNEFDELEI